MTSERTYRLKGRRLTFRLKCPDCQQTIEIDETTSTPCGCDGSTWRVNRDMQAVVSVEAPRPDADTLFHFWMSGHEDLAVSEMRNATEAEVTRFCEMLAGWRPGPGPRDWPTPHRPGVS